MSSYHPYWSNSLETRQSFLHVSTHQTYIGKALYEHATKCSTIAAVACVSSSVLRSSLGPNLLALITLDTATFPLFNKIFLKHSVDTLRFTQKIAFGDLEEKEMTSFLQQLNGDNKPTTTTTTKKVNKGSASSSSTSTFASSLQEIIFRCAPGAAITVVSGFRTLCKVSLLIFETPNAKANLQVLATLPNLAELEIETNNFDATLFKNLAEIGSPGSAQHNRHRLTSLTLLAYGVESFDPSSFRKFFCDKFLKQNHETLTKLFLCSEFWNSIEEDDDLKYMMNIKTDRALFPNLREFAELVPAVIITECPNTLPMLQTLNVGIESAEDLIGIQQNCPSLTELDFDAEFDTNDLMYEDEPFFGFDARLVEAGSCLTKIQTLRARMEFLVDDVDEDPETLSLIPSGFATAFRCFTSLQALGLRTNAFVAVTILQNLPNPQILRELSISRFENDVMPLKTLRKVYHSPQQQQRILFPALRKISFVNYYLDKKDWLALSFACPNLEEIELDDHGHDILDEAKSDCSNDSVIIREVCSHLPHLKRLALRFPGKPNWRYSDVEYILGNLCPKLLTLEFGRRWQTSDKEKAASKVWEARILKTFPRLVRFEGVFTALAGEKKIDAKKSLPVRRGREETERPKTENKTNTRSKATTTKPKQKKKTIVNKKVTKVTPKKKVANKAANKPSSVSKKKKQVNNKKVTKNSKK